jgi:hypothetical protein
MRYWIILLLTLTVSWVYGQDNILRDTNLSQAEFSVAMNPLDSNNIVLVTMHGFERIEDSYFSIYFSNDFGRSWNISEFDGFDEDLYIGAGDPVIKFDAQGAAILTGLVATVAFDIINIVYKSIDGGRTWTTEYTGADITVDKPWMAIDKGPTSPHSGNVYIPIVDFFNVNLTRLDSSLTLVGNNTFPDGDQIPSVVVNERTGDVFTSVITLDNPNVFYCQQWQDGGRTLVHSTIIDSTFDFTFNAPDVSQRYQPTPYLDIDNSGGPYDGRLYFSFTASEENNPRYFNVHLAWSDDDGLTWTTSKPVHSDLREEVQQFYSSSYVTNDGTLILDWYDRTNYEPGSSLTDFYMGISYDGGESFNELQLNSESMDFNFVSQAGFGFGIGEYHGLVSTNTTALSFWSDGRGIEANQNIYYARVNLRDGVSSVEEYGMINPDIHIGNFYPNPVQNEISLPFSTQKTKNISWQIISAEGKVLIQGSPHSYSAGQHQLDLKLNLPTGVYALVVRTEGWPVRSQVLVVE